MDILLLLDIYGYFILRKCAFLYPIFYNNAVTLPTKHTSKIIQLDIEENIAFIILSKQE